MRSVGINPSATVETLADLKALNNRPESVLVKGETSANDGWGGVFVWLSGDTTTADGYLYVQCTAGAAGRYKRISSPTYTARDVTVSGAADPKNYASYLSGTIDGSTTDFSWAYSVVNASESIDISGASAGAAVSGLYVNLAGHGGYGARNGIWSVYSHNAETTTASSSAFYTGIFSTVAVNATDGGGSGTEEGSFYGFGGLVTLSASATHINEAIGAEFDVSCVTGSSVAHKILLQLVTVNSDAVKGSTVDAGIVIAADSTTTTKLDLGIAFGKAGTKWPVSGTLIGAYSTTDSLAAVNGIDFSGITFSGSAFKSNNFSVSQAGAISGASLAATGAITGGTTATLTNAFAAYALLQAAAGTGFRWALSNDGTLRLQRTTDGFSTATVPLYIGTAGEIEALVDGEWRWAGRTRLQASGNGFLNAYNNAGTAGAMLDFSTDSTVKFRNSGNSADAAISAGTGAFSGAVSLGNTVNTVSPTSPNRTVTVVIGGTTYYLPAKTTND
jgi:predicted secreted protein